MNIILIVSHQTLTHRLTQLEAESKTDPQLKIKFSLFPKVQIFYDVQQKHIDYTTGECFCYKRQQKSYN